MGLIFAGPDLDRALADSQHALPRRIIVVVDDHPLSAALARQAAECASRTNRTCCFVVTWNDRFSRFLACAWLAMPVSSSEAAGLACESASRRARELMQSVEGCQGVTYRCRKGRPRGVARDLARTNGDAAVVVAVAPSAARQLFRAGGSRAITGAGETITSPVN